MKYDAQGNPVSEEELKNAVAVENGVYTFQLRHMEKNRDDDAIWCRIYRFRRTGRL